MKETRVRSLGWEDSLEKEMAIRSRFWRIPWTKEPDGLWSMGLQKVRHDWVTNTSFCKSQRTLNACFLLWWSGNYLLLPRLFIPYIKVINEELLLSFSLCKNYSSFSLTFQKRVFNLKGTCYFSSIFLTELSVTLCIFNFAFFFLKYPAGSPLLTIFWLMRKQCLKI